MTTRQTVTRIQIGCTTLLLVSFFLPIARGCTAVEIPGKQDSNARAKPEPAYRLELNRPDKVYAYEYVSAEQTSINPMLGRRPNAVLP